MFSQHEEEAREQREAVVSNPLTTFLTFSICRYRAIFSEIEMPWNWPVDVNYLEAKAFCNWKGDNYRWGSLPPFCDRALAMLTHVAIAWLGFGTESSLRLSGTGLEERRPRKASWNPIPL